MLYGTANTMLQYENFTVHTAFHINPKFVYFMLNKNFFAFNLVER